MLDKLFSKRTTPLLGLDIGTRYVKAVLLSKSGDRFKLEAYACEPISGNAFADREIKDFDAVSNAIRKAKLSLKKKCKNAAIAISGTSVITKMVFMDPDQSDHELESQIEVEADSLIPYPLDEVYLDFEELGDSKSHAGKVDVLLSAAHKDIVDGRVTLMRELELEPKVVDVEVYSLGTALMQFAEESTVCCISIGGSQLQFTAVEDNKVIYSKEHNFGLDSLVRDLALVYGMEPAEVEKQLLANTLPEGWRQQNWPIFLANLQQQMTRALQMYVTSTGRERPQQLLLAGGGAAISGIAADLEQELSMDVVVFNPFAQMQVSDQINQESLQQVAPQLAIAAGLASRSFESWHI
ncbi:type IV pilus assembly protein PilM [Aliiglaciecola sp. CAU 1673]|uniref:type IV pilus assembly protein PilM n=1 Tax=Aliiglaciecola sp. CAU 1673 TaxID=3032595 RepID=UPI0023DB257D|nr:type IV pilus assembly protein PilM [Aliiglaciecola sp. CAU 1673]MDF2178682.1 type IV pilus assembly protein PilM [Aliiglaciecola sp. CAU 1673]